MCYVCANKIPCSRTHLDFIIEKRKWWKKRERIKGIRVERAREKMRHASAKTYRHTSTHTHTLAHDNSYLRVYTRYMYTYTHAHTHTCIRILYTYINTYMHTYVHTYVHTHAYIHTYIHTYVICTDIVIKINFNIINETIWTDIGNGCRNGTGTENNPRIALKQRGNDYE